MGFTGGGSQGADAGHIEADGKDKGKALGLGKVGGEDRGNISAASGGLGSESGADEIPARSIEGVQYAEQGFFGDRGGAESHKSLPF